MDYTVRLRDMLEYMSDAELALQPGDITQQEGKRWQNMRLRSADLTGKAMTYATAYLMSPTISVACLIACAMA